MISTHVLDTNKGIPGQGIPVQLLQYVSETSQWIVLGNSRTDNDGMKLKILQTRKM